MAALTFAAIDVGSFEVEMGIYEISNRNKIRKLDQIRHVTALGKDTYNNGKISYEMVEELCDVLADFARIMKSYKVTEYRAYATSAMRGEKQPDCPGSDPCPHRDPGTDHQQLGAAVSGLQGHRGV